MKRIFLVVALAACTEHGRGGPTPAAPDDPPAACEGHCITDDPGTSSDACCDSVTCFIDDDTGEWVVLFCDPEPDPCLLCTADQLCVQAFDGACVGAISCVDRVVECPDNACTPDCELAYCGDGVSQCQNRLLCGTESPLAFTCYGP
jgi:hypothetical protein